jgi:hypothetical protein
MEVQENIVFYLSLAHIIAEISNNFFGTVVMYATAKDAVVVIIVLVVLILYIYKL